MRSLPRQAGVLAALVLLTLVAYQPALRGGFLWDDVDYIAKNDALADVPGLRRIWTEPAASDQYYPLVFTSFWVEARLFGQSPLGYHVVNVFLHALNAFLLWRLLLGLEVPGAMLAAFAFALHPVEAESVAWITERKNVLSGLFFFASALAFFRLRRPGDSRPPSWRWLAVSVVLFEAALLAKTATCTLPFVLALILWWKKGRLDRTDGIALAPLVVLAAAMPMITLSIESAYVGAGEPSLWSLDWLERALLAARATWFYAGKVVWPTNLVFVYPRWSMDATDVGAYAYPLALVAVLGVLWSSRGRLGRGPLAGALAFVVLLAPTLGFLDFYYMRYSLVADHFQYLASAALISLVSAGATTVARRLPVDGSRRIATALGIGLVACLAILTWARAHVYADEGTLWTDTVKRNPRAWMAWNNLGQIRLADGQAKEAIAHFERALELQPRAWEAYGGLADALRATGDEAGADAVFVRLASLVAQEKGEVPSSPPSIILVLVDTLRADYLGAYGFKGEVSPHFDAIAGEAVLFENSFTQAPWTKPAIASLFTSLYPEQHGVIAHDGDYGEPGESSPRAGKLPPRAVTLAESLRKAGYETAAFVGNPWIRRSLGFAQGFDVFDERNTGNTVKANGLFDKATAWLEARPDERPFFLYIHLMDVHGPYDAGPEDVEAVRGAAGLGSSRPLDEDEIRRLSTHLLVSAWTRRPEANDLNEWRVHYAAGVHALDRQLGKFVEGLRRDGTLDRSILVVTADHGEELADHGGWGHGGTLYEEQLRVPLIIRLPGKEAGGLRVKPVVSLIDLMPTLLDFVDAPVPPNLAGHTLGPLIAGLPPSGQSAAFAAGVKWHPHWQAVRTRRYKLMRDSESGKTTIFDLRRDPGEEHLLEEVPPGVRAALDRLVERHDAVIARGPSLPKESAALGPKVQEKLRSLGYLD